MSLFLFVFCLGFGAEAAAPLGATSAVLRSEESNPNPMLFPKDATPYGRSIERWSELLWSYIYAQPLDQNPFFDTTGANCGVGQEGPVWFLPAVPGSSLGTNITRSCTVPQDWAVMLQLSSILNDYPCPDPNFVPAPGQTLYDFLITPVLPLFDGETGFEITFDGVPLVDPLSYRFTSDDVFSFKADPSLVAFDSCVTGKRQQAVSDGFYLMFKPLSVGEHVIVVNGHDMQGVPVTLTERLTVR